MPWTTPETFTAGQTLTAASMNVISENTRVLRPDWAQARLTSGDLTLNSTAWANVSTATDLTLTASAGDVVQVDLSALSNTEAITLRLDVVTLVGSTVTNSFATGGAVSATSQGIMSWNVLPSVTTCIGGSFFYKLVSGDVSGGSVILRLRYRTETAGNKIIFASANTPLVFSARNHGAIEI